MWAYAQRDGRPRNTGGALGWQDSSGDEMANVNFYAVHPEATRIRWNNAKWRPLRRLRSFKVTNFGTNRKLIYDFLLVINTNLPPILHRFW